MTRVRSDLSDPVSAIPCGLQARNLGLTVLVPRHGCNVFRTRDRINFLVKISISIHIDSRFIMTTKLISFGAMYGA
jgi:hypothetical protein